MSHITSSPNMDWVTWTLPASKTDVRPLGTSRSWGCVCAGDANIACPLHAILAQHQHVKHLADEWGLEVRDTPLFPTVHGERITKEAAVATIKALAARIGQPTECPTTGASLFGGHSLRTGGAQSLAGLGVEPMRIQSMGRWRSSLVIRYSGAKGSAGITADAIKGLASRSSSSHQHPSPPALPCIAPALHDDSSVHTHMIHEHALSSMYDTSLDRAATFVENLNSGVVHKTVDDTKTLCGLHHAKWLNQKHSCLPEGISYLFLCSRCCKPERNSARFQEAASSSESD